MYKKLRQRIEERISSSIMEFIDNDLNGNDLLNDLIGEGFKNVTIKERENFSELKFNDLVEYLTDHVCSGVEFTEEFIFSVISNHEDYDNENNVIEMVEGLKDFDEMEKIVTDLIFTTKEIPSGVPHIKGVVTITNGVFKLKSFEVYENHDEV
jgi:hypothetical protein